MISEEKNNIISKEKPDLYDIFTNNMIESVYLPSKIKDIFKLDEKEIKIAKEEMKNL